MDSLRLGFSSGCFYKELSTKEALAFLKKEGCRITELHPRIEEMDALAPEDLAGFDYMSLHAPKFDYAQSEGSKNILDKIARIHSLRPLDAVVVHPDPVSDFAYLASMPFPVGIENMDRRKPSYRRPAELKALLDAFPQFRLVLDVNHVFTNDPEMKDVPEFFGLLGGRIAQYHLSGYAELHDPLFKTRQAVIIAAMRNLSLPVIIESILSPSEFSAERDFILAEIGKKIGEPLPAPLSAPF